MIMHMADSLLSPAVGITMCAVSAAAVAWSIKRDKFSEKKVPMMGVMGAFIFAAQMVNIAIPATGSSGHITGGILLAAMLGGGAALLSMSAVLVIQCLFFADGGLLALGCNIFNLGVVPCLIVYPLIFKSILEKDITPARITVASVFASAFALQLGAFGVVLQTSLSGVAALPLATFAMFMQPIHLAIGIAEGIVTAAILRFVYKARPEIWVSAFEGADIKSGVSMRKTFIVFTIIALLTGGVFSQFSSAKPDGLEWSIEKASHE
jgi:cobalt/nickel transport system permease protein